MRQGTRAGFHLEETAGKMMLRNRACGRFGAPHRLLVTRLSFHSRLPRLLQHNQAKRRPVAGSRHRRFREKLKEKKFRDPGGKSRSVGHALPANVGLEGRPQPVWR